MVGVSLLSTQVDSSWSVFQEEPEYDWHYVAETDESLGGASIEFEENEVLGIAFGDYIIDAEELADFEVFPGLFEAEFGEHDQDEEEYEISDGEVEEEASSTVPSSPTDNSAEPNQLVLEGHVTPNMDRMTKLEELLTYRITHLLPTSKLDGVVHIIGPKAATALASAVENLDEGFTVDLQAIPQAKLLELNEYVNICIEEEKDTSRKSPSAKRKRSDGADGTPSPRRHRQSSLELIERSSNQDSDDEIDVVGF